MPSLESMGFKCNELTFPEKTAERQVLSSHLQERRNFPSVKGTHTPGYTLSIWYDLHTSIFETERGHKRPLHLLVSLYGGFLCPNSQFPPMLLIEPFGL